MTEPEHASGPLPLPRYAEALAWLRAYPDTDHPVLLERLGVTPDALAASDAFWSRELSAAIGRRDPTLALRFARAYAHAERNARYKVPVRRVAPDPKLDDPSPRRQVPARMASVALPEPSSPGLGAAADPTAANADPKHVPTYLMTGAQQVALETSPLASTVEPELDVDQTAKVSLYKVARGRELPFEHRSPLAQLARLHEAGGKDESSPPVISSGERGTVALPDGLESGVALPFDEPAIRPQDVDLSMFPIERYAEITVALSTNDDRGKVLRRYVLTESMWRAVAQAWALRINDDPSLRAAFNAAVQQARRS